VNRVSDHLHIPAWLPDGLEPLAPTLLTCRAIPFAAGALRRELGCKPEHVSLGLVTADQDDSLYAALDHATKFARVDVVYAKSFYAGSAHASGPLSGEILGILAAEDPQEIDEALHALRAYLAEHAHFYKPRTLANQPAFFPHVIAETGQYLSGLAGIPAGAPLAYLIAPPLESMIAVDAALKAADVQLCRHFGPPTETNFGGAYLTGPLHAVEAAAAAFAEAVLDVAQYPLAAARRADRDRA
jgi:ethanolamine utilization protein EutL